MDVNGTRFHLLLGRDDWGRRCRTKSGPLEESFVTSEKGGDAELSWDAQRNELTLGKRVFFFRSSPGNRPVEPGQRRGAAMDRFGNAYWISAGRTEILVSSAATGVTAATTHFWSSLYACNKACDTGAFGGFSAIPSDTAAAEPIALSGLAVTTQHYLVAGTIDPPGLLIFDLQTGGEPRQLLWPVPVPFAPFDLSAAKDGGVFVLDQQGARAWRLDRTFAVVGHGGAAPLPQPEDFTAIDGGASHPAAPPPAVTLELAVALTAANPVAIAALPDGSFLILDSPPGAAFSTIVRYQDGEPSGTGVSTGVVAPLVDPGDGSTFRLLGHDFAYVEKRAGTQEPYDDLLYVTGENGDQTFAFHLIRQGVEIVLDPLPEYFPMRLFAGKALLVGPAGQAYYDLEDRWVPLVAQRRGRFATSARFYAGDFDGKQPDCVWHRLMIDAWIPPECEIAVASRAGNDETLLPFLAWNEHEPQLLRRATGSELPWETAGRAAGYGTWELLFQSAKGRYLELRLTLSGSGRSTPRVRALRAWYPRFSYQDHYLPAAYREAPGPASFLDRFLANFEGFFTNIEDRIATVQLLLDVRSAPAEALEWLASWFGVALDPAWDEARRRLFLRHAADFFEWRGTVPGLMMALRLVLDDCPGDSIFDLPAKRSPAIRIVEKFRTRTVPAAVYSAVTAAATTTTASGTSAASGLPLRAQQAQWDPSQGAAGLQSRFTAATGNKYTAMAPDRQKDPAGWTAWGDFSRQTLGFVPQATSADAGLWLQFLQGRYSNLAALNAAWSASYGDWSNIALPDVPPRSLAVLRDWLVFEGIVLPSRKAAHRFTVFLPQSTLMADDKRLDLARRVVGLEKPAHTSFDVQFYWAYFRVGEARLGTDTLVDLGGRSPAFLAPFVLDQSYLGSGYLAPDRRNRLSSPCPRPDGGCPPSRTAGGSR
jgi:phage tail-like protein